MPGSRIVPTLAALVLAGGLAASDGIAPVITLLDADIQPTVPSIYRDETDPITVLDGTVLQDDLYLYNSAAPTGSPWEEFDNNYLGITSAGIAIVAADTRGVWQYRVNQGSWIDIDQTVTPLSATNALLLSLWYNQTELRFVPDGAQFPTDDTATLTFRAWDGSSFSDGQLVSTDNPDSILDGGSPTPFSAETRSVQVLVKGANNQPPVIADPDNWATISASSPIDINAGDSLDITSLNIDATDADLDALTWLDSSIAYTDSGVSGSTFQAGHEPGQVSATFAVSDGHGGSDYITLYFNIINSAPTISDNNSIGGTIVDIEVGQTIDLADLGVSASDPDGDALTWSGTSVAYSYGYIDGSSYSPYAGNVGLDDTVTFTVDDGYGGTDSISVTFHILAHSNNAPVIEDVVGLDNSEGYSLNVSQGASSNFTVYLSDAELDTVLYEGLYYSPGAGTLSDPVVGQTQNGWTPFTFTYTHDGSDPSYGDSFEVQFGDGVDSTYLYVNVYVSPNNLPQVITSVPGIAVVGQPYDALITIEDADADPTLTLTATGYSLQAVTTTQSFTVGYNNVTRRTYRLSFTPTAVGTTLLELISNDGTSPNTENFNVTVADPPVETITHPTVPVSTPGNPIYAAIAPGSTAGFNSLLGALAPHGPDIARGWWWSTPGAAFYDMESSPVSTRKQPMTAIFLASTVGLTYSFDAKPYPMPFAIDLPPADAQATGPGSDGWTFFGVPALWDGASSTLTHDLSDFVLETADGQRVTSDSEILNALAPVDDTAIQAPWSYDPSQPVGSRYQAASSLNTGVGYWIRNRSTISYRLVRVASDDYSGTRLSSVGYYAGARAAAAVSTGTPVAADLPPTPPSGMKAAAESPKSKAADGCGVGGLAGLLIAGLALLGFGTRRRN
jgi:hypothetical protein